MNRSVQILVTALPCWPPSDCTDGAFIRGFRGL